MPSAAPEHRRRLAVLGSPIGHSLSPRLHRAAYAALGLDWDYEAIEVRSGGLGCFLAGLGPDWRGLSVTMPLKGEALRLARDVDAAAAATGSVNTIVFDGDSRGYHGYNTDVAGIVRALDGAGVRRVGRAWILGAGATAASALSAVVELGAQETTFWARTPAKAEALRSRAEAEGCEAEVRELAALSAPAAEPPELVVSTLPGDARPTPVVAEQVRRQATLFDVAYAPWPSALARQWNEVGGTSVSGLAMLVHQALIQVRLFVSGDPHARVPGEDAVLEAMLSTVGLGHEGDGPGVGAPPAMPES